MINYKYLSCIYSIRDGYYSCVISSIRSTPVPLGVSGRLNWRIDEVAKKKPVRRTVDTLDKWEM